jgi:hypothetical protein
VNFADQEGGDVNDDMEFGTDEDLESTDRAWWAPASLLSAEAAAITAFSFAVLAMFGGATIAPVVARALAGNPWDGDLRGESTISAGVAMLFALGGLVLARRVLTTPADAPPGSVHLARAAVVLASAAGVLAAVAVLAGVVGAGPGG